MAEEKCGFGDLARRLFIAAVGGLPMSEYPELIEIIQGFARRYARRTERGLEFAVTDEEFRILAEFLAHGLVEYAEAAGSTYENDSHKFLHFSNLNISLGAESKINSLCVFQSPRIGNL
jgi:hypothetical protein